MTIARMSESCVAQPARRRFALAVCLGVSIGLALAACVSSLHAAPRIQSPVVSMGPDSRLVYALEERGDRLPDFSHCGYAGGDRPIPNAPVRIVVPAAPGDSTRRIQRAIDHVSGLPEDRDGLRGAVLLARGRHEVAGSLRLNRSGVVLRGQGTGENGTLLVAVGHDRRTLIRIAGIDDRTNRWGKTLPIQDAYVPVGARRFRVREGGLLKAGDTIRIVRPSTQAWIDRLGMTEFGGGQGDWRLVWKPGSRDLVWDRVVVEVQGDSATVDAPITTALDLDYGGGWIEPYEWPGRIRQVGIENLRCESAFDPGNPRDENHSWCAVTIENARDAWVRQVAGKHFAGSLVAVYESSQCVTVQDCRSIEPVSEEGGYRRHTFFTMGQLTLFLRCHAERGRHDFAVGHCAAGPNAFVCCEAAEALGDSGPIESWASGVLYDGVTIDGSGLSLAHRGASPHGAGWAAANSILWQCNAAFLRCASPPGARNWALGCWGEFEGNGIWRNSNEFIQPESLYRAQVADRLGNAAASRIHVLQRSRGEATNPGVDAAAKWTAVAHRPAPRLSEFIAAAPERDPIPAHPNGAPDIDHLPAPIQSGISPDAGPSLPARLPVQITNGWLVCDGRLLAGGKIEVAWWRGNIRPGEASAAGAGITRFVPGRIGPGFTDNLEQLADILIAGRCAALDHHYGLWYERRRDDHQRVRRPNGDAWPPFYEMPFARSGRGTAWDGLSRYDLARYNPWYWDRLKEFADICDRRGLVLFHQNYFQHHILEAGAHWADFPWRTANNVNDTGFPEPPPYAGDKRIFMAEQFYDVTHPVRRQLHRSYIRKCLDSFAANSNVIQFTSAEFTGPLHFVEFWLDTIAEWQRETARNPLVALSCTKDVQDAILDDPERSRVVDVVDFRYWWVADRGVFAPRGGQNLAPRQFERQWKGGRPNDVHLAAMAGEYRQRFPDKAIICDFDSAGWAFACAGGSMPRLPAATDPSVLEAIPRMRPWIRPETPPGQQALADGHRAFLIWSSSQEPLQLDLDPARRYIASWIDPETGRIARTQEVAGGRRISLAMPFQPAVLWLRLCAQNTFHEPALPERGLQAASTRDRPNARKRAKARAPARFMAPMRDKSFVINASHESS